MKKILTKPETIKQKEYVSDVICDFCEKDVEHCQNSWGADQIKLEANIGSVYPECDSRTLYILDVCSECFLEKIKPTIESLYKVNFREIDSGERYIKHE